MNKTLDQQGLMKLLLSTPVLILLALVSTFGYAAWLPLFDLDEGAFTTATREMIETGNWISTYMNGVPRHDKPILIYWLQALSVSGFGLNTFSLRLPSCLAALAWIWISYRFVKEQRDDTEARLMVWLLAALPLASIIFKAAIADALLNFLLCATFFDIYRYFQRADNATLLRIGIWLGLGFLTKGPIACALPLIASLVLFAFEGRFKDWLRAVFHPIIIITFIVIVLPWHIAVYLDQGWEFFKGFYLKHNIDRFSTTMESHGGKPYYYMMLLPLLFVPFTGLIAPVIKSLFKQRPRGLELYLITWFLLVLVIFSFSKTQLPHYILYGVTPILFLMARHLLNAGFWSLSAPALTILLVSLLPLFFGYAAEQSNKPFDKAVLELATTEYNTAFQAISVLGLLLIVALYFFKNTSYPARLLVGAAGSMLMFNFLLLPLLGAAQQEPVREAALLAKKIGGPVVSYGINMPSFSVYRDAIVPRRAPQRGELVFTRIDKQENLLTLDPAVKPTRLYAKGGVALYSYE
ncbi:ArnT family glycosyltransferase [Neptunomonas qingdaonensis]|uniref:Dolichyl-phosphate-mannose-protein mannosyltransferase n=1 Tax=Neptunomonas qingdaonensis TaxID=1045558 RepID=A0A1I2VJL4_9GAMM|nr:glycosyltransferase family 39 protein [Neptunomonas qingdaonensis]SFG89494.1 Dolichyl-phosphate-mannose-protein mannosyltransferase [Neptunomonas qingdaonensis]